MSDFVEKVVTSLEKYEEMKTQIVELTKKNLENENIIKENRKLIEKFYKPFIDDYITEEQFGTIVKKLEESNFTVSTYKEPASLKIRVLLELEEFGEY